MRARSRLGARRFASAASAAATEAAAAQPRLQHHQQQRGQRQHKQQGSTGCRRCLAFSSSVRLKEISARSGSNNGGRSRHRRERGSGTWLAVGFAHLCLQPAVVEPVELHVADDRQHVFGRLEVVHLYHRSAQGGARRPARSTGDGRFAGPARGRRAAPACEWRGRKNSIFRPSWKKKKREQEKR